MAAVYLCNVKLKMRRDDVFGKKSKGSERIDQSLRENKSNAGIRDGFYEGGTVNDRPEPLKTLELFR